MAKEYSLSDLNKNLKKINPFAETLKDSSYAKVTEHIHTGNYHLNACFSGSLFGGIQNNRAICLAGESGTGKTYLLLNMCREAQKMGYHIYFYDTEGAVDIDTASKFGIDPLRFEHQPMGDIATFRTSITTLTKSLIEAKIKGFKIPKIMICLDSLGMLATTKEIDDALSGSVKADMTRAKAIRSLFRIITSDLTGLHIPFVFTNHTYASTGMFPTINLSGGGGLLYAASIILALMKAKLKDDKSDGKLQTGIIVTAKTLKNRFAKPNDIKFHINFSRGMNPYVGLENYISWKNCGIQKGQICSEKDYSKASDKDKENFHQFKDDKGKKVYFVARDTARNFVVKHLGCGVPVTELFTPEVFTEEILKNLDENFIQPKWSYGNNEDAITEINEILNISDDEKVLEEIDGADEKILEQTKSR